MRRDHWGTRGVIGYRAGHAQPTDHRCCLGRVWKAIKGTDSGAHRTAAAGRGSRGAREGRPAGARARRRRCDARRAVRGGRGARRRAGQGGERRDRRVPEQRARVHPRRQARRVRVEPGRAAAAVPRGRRQARGARHPPGHVERAGDRGRADTRRQGAGVPIGSRRRRELVGLPDQPRRQRARRADAGRQAAARWRAHRRRQAGHAVLQRARDVRGGQLAVRDPRERARRGEGRLSR